MNPYINGYDCWKTTEPEYNDCVNCESHCDIVDLSDVEMGHHEWFDGIDTEGMVFCRKFNNLVEAESHACNFFTTIDVSGY